MSSPRITKAFGKSVHHSVGAIIKNGDKCLVMKRNLPPQGYAFVAGHIDIGEKASEALDREVKEETNLDIIEKKFLFRKFITQEEDCVFKSRYHIFYIYNCKVSGELKPDKKEVKSIKFIPRTEIKKLYKQGKIEYAWTVLFKKLKIV